MLEIPECKFENVELEMYPEERELYKCAFIESQEMIKDIFQNGGKREHVQHGNFRVFVTCAPKYDLPTNVHKWYCKEAR